jgi:hypothetical protein
LHLLMTWGAYNRPSLWKVLAWRIGLSTEYYVQAYGMVNFMIFCSSFTLNPEHIPSVLSLQLQLCHHALLFWNVACIWSYLMLHA